jgi:hypothetical protein
MQITLGDLRELISEKIRDNRGVRPVFPTSHGKKFNLAEFEALTEDYLRRDYCDARLQLLGEGSTRKVYVLTSRTALKLATNRQGIGQNSAEAKMSKDPSVTSIVARVLRSSSDHSWIVSELVKPVSDNTMQFNRWFDHEYGAPSDAEDPLLKQMLWSDEEDLAKFYFRGQIPHKTLEFMQAFQNVVQKYELEFSDVTKASSWGRTSDGRLVLLDYGFSHETIKNYYS